MPNEKKNKENIHEKNASLSRVDWSLYPKGTIMEIPFPFNMIVRWMNEYWSLGSESIVFLIPRELLPNLEEQERIYLV